jgi:hypothetical protein
MSTCPLEHPLIHTDYFELSNPYTGRKGKTPEKFEKYKFVVVVAGDQEPF